MTAPEDNRVARLATLAADAGLDAVVVTSEASIAYLTGFWGMQHERLFAVVVRAEGELRETDIAGDLGDVVRGSVSRSDAAERTVFKSVGLPVEDLVIARAAVDRLRETGRLP